MKSELKRLFSRAAMMLLIMLLTTTTAWAQDAITGLTYNTTGGYYEIPDADALNALRTYVNQSNDCSGKTFKQTADITLTSAFSPIGNSSSNIFQGTYNGNGKTISGLTIEGGNTIYQALFGNVQNATIQNLTLSGACITGGSYAGAFVGYSWGGLTMTNCHAVNCTVSGYNNVGIFVGDLEKPASTIKSCTATGGSVSGNSKVGAIVGYSSGNGSNIHKIVGCVGRLTTGGANVVGQNNNNSSQIIASYGSDAYTITAGEGVTITYSAVNNTYSDVIHPPYIVAGETVPVTLSYTGSLSNYTFQVTGATLNDACTQLSNAQGNVTITATEVQKTDISNGSIADIAVQTWTGSAITPAPVVTVGHNTLTATTDYLVNYSDNTNLGTATVTVTGTGAYEGTLSKTFEIQHADMPYNSTEGCYEIGNETALRALSSYVSSGGGTTGKTFTQTADITLTSAFSPIGNSSSNIFQGTYNGGNFTTKGLNISGSIADAALFGYMNGATVKNVILISPSVSSSYGVACVSALVGYMNGSSIDNCHVVNPTLSATGAGSTFVGVFIGKWGGNCSISNCYFYDCHAAHNYAAFENTNSVPANSSSTNVERVYTLTTADCTATATPTVTIGATKYYKSGTAVTISKNYEQTSSITATDANSQTIALTDQGDGTYTFSMPTSDVSVVAITNVIEPGWTLVGTYKTQNFDANDTYYYGFVGTAGTGTDLGTFVQVGGYVRVKPMRAYLVAPGGTPKAAARRMTRAAEGETMPSTLRVRLLGSDGQTTGILSVNGSGFTVQGSDAWYSLDGRKLAGKPTQKGLYIHNGRKVVIK